MAPFTAINVEPEDSIDEQVDNTRELQIDDALKRFQAALKLHAQGPGALAEASDAYDDLFKADIFRYPEAQTDYDRSELGHLAAAQPFDHYHVPSSEVENTATSLSQAYYLAYKNRGLLALDRIRRQASSTSTAPPPSDDAQRLRDDESVAAVMDDARRALADFDVALDKDPSDADLWRQTARVAASLNSTRTKRYCLEAAIELDDDPTVVEVQPPTMVEALAGEQLKLQLRALGDEVALSHPIMKPWVRRRMPAMLRRQLDPLPFLSDPTTSLEPMTKSGHEAGDVQKVELNVPTASWTGIGEALVAFIEGVGMSGQGIRLRILEDDEEMGGAQDDGLNGWEGSEDEEVEEVSDEPGHGATKDVTDVAMAGTGDDSSGHGTNGPSNGTNGTNCANGDSSYEQQLPSIKLQEPPSSQNGSFKRHKRSQSAAGIPDTNEEAVAEKRSKRIRRRDTAAEETVDPTTLMQDQLGQYHAADRALFELTQRLLRGLGVNEDAVGLLDKFVSACSPEDRSAERLPTVAMADFRRLLTTFGETSPAHALLKKEPAKDQAADQAKERLGSFIDHVQGGNVKEATVFAPFDDGRGVRRFVAAVNEGWATCLDVAYGWMLAMSASWSRSRWPDAMASAARKLAHVCDGFFYDLARERDCGVTGWGRTRQGTTTTITKTTTTTRRGDGSARIDRLVQMLFEIHVDNYAAVTQPASIAPWGDREEVLGRARRWQDLASDWAALRPPEHELTARLLWHAVLMATTLSQSDRQHKLRCWGELRDFFAAGGRGLVTLPNSSTVPAISAAAAEREISKLTTMDFFISLFKHDHVADPLHVIDSLEPVLNPASIMVVDDEVGREQKDHKDQKDEAKRGKMSLVDCAGQRLRDIWKFLDGSTPELRLFLWTRLGEAYGLVEYRTKQFSCHLRTIEMLVAELGWPSYEAASGETRQALLAHTLRCIDEPLTRALSMALNDSTAYDVVDEPHLAAAAAALARLCSLLHVAMALEDEMRVGLTPQPSTAASLGLTALLAKVREMQVRAWCLLYSVVKAGTQLQQQQRQRRDEADTDAEADLGDLLAATHQVLGLRRACQDSNKIFLQMMRIELLKCRTLDRWEEYMGQVLYDLYGLKLGVGGNGNGISSQELQDHGVAAEMIGRRTTMQLVGRVVAMARRLPMRDLLKSDLKVAIESLQQAIGQPRSSAQMVHNVRNMTELLRRPINPLRLYKALARPLATDSVDVRTPETPLARHGWFFLLGMIALARFKAADLKKRQTPGTADDLRLGATWIRLQLQFTPDRWEAWFRLGECFDYELEDAVLWTADKMNKDRAELVKLQRSAIHCYTQALSLSGEGNQWKEATNGDGDDQKKKNQGRDDEDDNQDDNQDAATKEALYELYHTFAMRMYASSRDPFAMEPFLHTDVHFLIQPDATTKPVPVHAQMSEFNVWRYAAALFRRAAHHRPGEWKNHYMLAKCLWKMHCADGGWLAARDPNSHSGPQQILDPLRRAVGLVSGLPRSRHAEPVLEPHYKMLSLVNKLVLRGDMAVEQGAAILAQQPFGVRLDDEDDDDDDDEDDDDDDDDDDDEGQDDENDGDEGDEESNGRSRSRSRSCGTNDGNGVDDDANSNTISNTNSTTANTVKKINNNAHHHLPKIRDLDDWEEYVIRSLRMLRDKDKANWHHRIIMRHARIVFNEQLLGEEPRLQAMGAFNVLRDSMFTKTMVMNVWKCDAERPGRHHVYTERYARFMVRLLVATGDRANLELLLRRIRKKGADFYLFPDLWSHACMAYLQVLRKTYKIGVLPEDHFRGVYTDEFDAVGEKIGAYFASAGAGTPTPAFECMRDAIELKKLNSNLMRAAPIDDLISDCYGAIYFEVGGKLAAGSSAATTTTSTPCSSSSLSTTDAPKGLAPAPTSTPTPLSTQPAQTGFALGVLRPLNVSATTNRAINPLNLGFLLNPAPSPTPVSAPTPAPDRDTSTPCSVAVAPAAEAPKARKPGIRRPEVLRKAELVLNRSLEPARSGAPSKSRNGIVGPRSAPMKRNGDSNYEQEDDSDDDDDTEMRDADEGDGSGIHTTGGGDDDEDAASVASKDSAQHFADDESDLSDVPDDDEMAEESTLLFPGLSRPGQVEAGGGGDAAQDTGTAGGVGGKSDTEEEGTYLTAVEGA